MRRVLVLVALLTWLLPAGIASADGVIIDPPPPCPPGRLPCPPPPDPRPLFPLAIQSHRVTVTIANQVATTRVDQVFRNDFDFTVEGTYIFPIPAEAAVADFAMWVNGERVEGRVLSAEEARQIYDDIVRQALDPALLEYAGRGAVMASIFPIPPGETRRVELEYSQVLAAENGLIHYRYPLNTEKFSTLPLEQVSISVNVQSAQAVRAVYSPSHPVSVAREGEFRFSAGYEANQVLPDTDFDLYYSVSPEAIGLNLLTATDPATGEGFFLLLAAPSLGTGAAEVVAKDVIVVLDQSGSMEGEKFAQAQAALDYILRHLNAEDRFNLIAFSTGTRHYAPGLVPASQAEAARDWVRGLWAEGGTNINLALLEAVGLVETGSARPTLLIFLTDGLATEGVTNPDAILASARQATPASVRLFTFGVGDDVDTLLLDALVQQHHGASSYVRPGERIDEAISGFYARVSAPVLADLALRFEGLVVEDVYPNPLPDLFAGSQLVVSGRYRAGSSAGPVTVTLSGNVNGRPQEYVYPGQAAGESSGGEFIPRLWATRRIGHLLTEMRLHGENRELIDAVVRLSVRYGIVTPYTSYLVTETEADVLTEEGRDELAAKALALATPAPASGGAAVDAAEAQATLAGAAAAPEMAPEAADVVRVVGSRAFLLRDGVWVDTAFDASSMQAVPVAFASDAYFELLSAHPELGPALALGPSVIAFAGDGTAYAISAGELPVAVTPLGPTPVLPTPDPARTPVPVTPVPVTAVPVTARPGATPAPTPAAPPRGLALATGVGLSLGLSGLLLAAAWVVWRKK